MSKQSYDVASAVNRWYRSRLAIVIESILTGFLVGFVVLFFRLSINRGEDGRRWLYARLAQEAWWWTALWALCLVLAGLFLGWAASFRPMIKGSGIPQIKGVLLRKLQLRWPSELPLKLITGIIGLGAGLSLGREGPSIQIGAYVGRGVLSVTRRHNWERKSLITSAAAAGIAAAFNAPLAGVIFALEEFQKSFSPLLLACVMGSSWAANMAASTVFGLDPVFDFREITPLTLESFPWIALLGILCGLGGDLFKRLLYFFQDLYPRLHIPQILRPVLPLLISIPLGFFLFDLTGGGHALIEKLSWESSLPSILLLTLLAKMVWTALCYGSGASGGIFLPLLACGALLGTAFGEVLTLTGLSAPDSNLNFMILGMAAFFTGVVKAPVTGAVLILEMSGNFNHLGSLVLACLSALVASDLIRSRAVYDVLLDRILLGRKPEQDEIRQKGKIIIEIQANPSSAMVHRSVKHVPWPSDCLVVGINRGENEILPTGDTEILPGDRLVILTYEINAAENTRYLNTLAETRDSP
ncbi:MAG: ClC family H(+)/Cl(-) exchange transporter [Spirochaetales bacterium]|nr:ClC family H(+)/Cl(-) exchange transporter [Spirochaetales bacterium]